MESRLSGARALMIAAVLAARSSAASGACDCPNEFALRYAGSTTMQIALAWAPVPDAIGYVLERSTSCDFASPTTYTVSGATTAYGDTGKPPDARDRFNAWSSRTPSTLVSGFTYNYRIRAQLADQSTRMSNCVAAQLDYEPVRGVAGDAWADVVLGQPDFTQSDFAKTDDSATQMAGGVLIDRSHVPNRLYLADPNHNRVLGFDHFGRCATVQQGAAIDAPDAKSTQPSSAYPDNGGQELATGSDVPEWRRTTGHFGSSQGWYAAPLLAFGEAPKRITTFASSSGGVCSVDADCDEGEVCLPDPDLRPQIVIGQPSLVDHAACNGDATGQAFPARAPATAATLCLIDVFHMTPAETIYAAMMAVDDEGSLYVPDLFNHRVLKYIDPFGTDQIADDVWGQADFSGNRCNRGGPPGAHTLCFGGTEAPHAGVDFDSTGNMWVADPSNARVLRFPNLGGGHIAHEADIVLGQPSFASNERGGPTDRNAMRFPLDVAVDRRSGYVYVADAYPGAGRALEFRPPFVSGMAAARVLRSPFCHYSFIGVTFTSVATDTQMRGLWTQNNCGYTELFDLTTASPSLRLRVYQYWADGIGLNAQGDLFIPSKDTGLQLFKRESLGRDYLANVDNHLVFSGTSPVSADAMRFNHGATVLGDQLIVADGRRMLIWNDPVNVQTGQPADDVYGQPDFSTYDLGPDYAFPQSYNGQLWVDRPWWALRHDVLVFDPPLTNASAPVAVIPVKRENQLAYPVLGCPGPSYCNCAGQGCTGGAIYAGWADVLDFAPAADGDELWVADHLHSRVYRIANLRGRRDAGGAAFVDVILGQPDLANTKCNRGARSSPGANTLCYPSALNLDAAGNLWVADNGTEGGTNTRVLEYDAAQLVVSPAATHAVFAPDADLVLGTGGDFNTVGLLAATDPVVSPFKPGFHPNGALTITNNPYTAPRFGLVYLHPFEDRLPQFMLADMLSYPDGGVFFDTRGDLYVSDRNWSRVLIYRQPLALLEGTPRPTRTPQPTHTPTMTATPTVTPTPVPSCPSGLSVVNATLKIQHNLDPVGDEQLDLRGRVEFPAPVLTIDPIADGFSFAITSQSGALVFSRAVAPGASTGEGETGWRMNRTGTRWTYRDRLGIAPGGIRRVIIGRWREGKVFTFHVTAARSDFQIDAAQLPLRIQVALGGVPQTVAGRCATFAFNRADGLEPKCQLLRDGDTVSCR